MREGRRPGELLAADTFYVDQFNGIGKVYLHTVIERYGSYAFGFLHTCKLPTPAITVLDCDMLPLYAERELAVGAILTDNGREFCGTAAHPYELYLALNDLEHRRTKVKHPYTNGFVERFHLTKGGIRWRDPARNRLRLGRGAAARLSCLANPLQHGTTPF